MKSLANLVLVTAATAFGYGGGSLLLVLTYFERVPSAEVSLRGPGIEAQLDHEQGKTSAWPPIFGKPLKKIEPDAKSEVMIGNYTLKGLFVGRTERWAILGTANRDILVGPGDTLPQGEMIADIDKAGVWIELGTRRDLIHFANSTPIETAIVEEPAVDTKSTGSKGMVRTQGLEEKTLHDLLETARKVKARAGKSTH